MNKPGVAPPPAAAVGGGGRRPSMASPIPNETDVDKYIVTDEEFEYLQNFDWSCVSHEILNDLEFITKLPTTPVLDYDSLGALLPPAPSTVPPKTLFIDLDETLVHTALGALEDVDAAPRHDLSFVSDTDGSVQARVYFRPWTADFLKIMSQYYELVLYTASVKLYADIIIDELDQDGYISHRLYREHCTQYGESEIYFKDLNGTGRDLKNSVVMDNRLISFGLNISNGIFVSSFTGQAHDTELLHLLPILVALSKQEDVRVALAETYKLPTIVQRYRQDINADVARSLTNIGSPRAHRVDDTTSLHTHAIQTLGSMSNTADDECQTRAQSDDDDDDHGAEKSDGDGVDEELEAEEAEEENEETIFTIAHKRTESGSVSVDRSSVLLRHDGVEPLSETESSCEMPLASPASRINTYRLNDKRVPSYVRETSPPESVISSSTRQASSTRHMQALSRISLTRDNATNQSPAVLSGAPPQFRLLHLSASDRQASLRRLVLPQTKPERRRKLTNPFKQVSRVSIAVHNKRPVAPKTLYN